jgi:hypothetical protein
MLIEKLITGYQKLWIVGLNLDLCHLDRFDILGEKMEPQGA